MSRFNLKPGTVRVLEVGSWCEAAQSLYHAQGRYFTELNHAWEGSFHYLEVSKDYRNERRGELLVVRYKGPLHPLSRYHLWEEVPNDE